MPQMMPLSWLLLFTMFSSTLILFASMNYYNNISKVMITKKKTITNKITPWKW
uniref:ATP synthase complex subunit 8 n=1 Tax=Rugitermes sp. A TB-2014 TaxID=1576355 RepID=A0A0A7E8V0_9NEOP|nr:ATP synthase F0 subunit 8 [Rugitermes sp. A TB-2014]